MTRYRCLDHSGCRVRLCGGNKGGWGRQEFPMAVTKAKDGGVERSKKPSRYVLEVEWT